MRSVPGHHHGVKNRVEKNCGAKLLTNASRTLLKWAKIPAIFSRRRGKAQMKTPGRCRPGAFFRGNCFMEALSLRNEGAFGALGSARVSMW